ncbi:response regulator transcription factor [Lysinibacillus macroides]|uniref:Transcriptional regulator n=1 Tax=Lysinibacillus macroides TaxID=33935 RepID=A0A0N0UX66_9BACI|nr:LytTR family DNA-binding domain-containing protein [Lysinibacillus macroides]KOY83241.1 transcriptional regulator [Lysinibacillus macroides]QPR69102.1 response regulator transcription factor [Lysinibacillus macroides]
MKIVICEDDVRQRKFLQSTIIHSSLFQYEDVEIALVASNPSEVFTYLQDNRADCFLLDIELQHEINGLELANVIREKDPLATIIFITTYADKLRLTFTYKIAALDFIVKNEPNLAENLIKTLQIAYQKHQSIHTQNIGKHFQMKIGEYVKLIPFEDIYCFATSANSHKIKMQEKSGVYEFFNNLTDIEQQLDERFFRCHRGYIVNLQQIQKIDITMRTITLKNSSICYYSLRYKKALMKALSSTSTIIFE